MSFAIFDVVVVSIASFKLETGVTSSYDGCTDSCIYCVVELETGANCTHQCRLSWKWCHLPSLMCII